MMKIFTNLATSLFGSRTNMALITGLLSVTLAHFNINMDLSFLKDGLQLSDVGTVVSMVLAMVFRANPKWSPPVAK